MQWITADDAVGELSPHEQTIADLAIKVTTERAAKGQTSVVLSKTAELEQLCGHHLPVEDLLAVGKVAALFAYWQETNRTEPEPPPAPPTPTVRPQASLEPHLPYYFEGAHPPLADEYR